jgi:hypothetical protein
MSNLNSFIGRSWSDWSTASDNQISKSDLRVEKLKEQANEVIAKETPRLTLELEIVNAQVFKITHLK